MKSWILSLLSLVALIAACQNDDDSSADLQKITGKNWMLSSEEIIHVSDNGRLESISTDDCRKDDVYYFNADGNYSITPGSEVCQYESSLLVTGTWDWEQNHQPILFSLQVLSVSSSSLKARIDFSGRLPVLMTFTVVN